MKTKTFTLNLAGSKLLFDVNINSDRITIFHNNQVMADGYISTGKLIVINNIRCQAELFLDAFILKAEKTVKQLLNK